MHSSLGSSRRSDTRRQDLVSHGGAELLAELVDRSGLTEAISVAMENCGIS